MTLCISCTVGMCNQCHRKKVGLVHSTPCKSAKLSILRVWNFVYSKPLVPQEQQVGALAEVSPPTLRAGEQGGREGGKGCHFLVGDNACAV